MAEDTLADHQETAELRAALAACVDLIERWAYGPVFESVGISWPDGVCQAPALLRAKAILCGESR